MSELVKVLSKVQAELKAPKNQYNSFGKYWYRNAEDIMEALKPIMAKYGAVVTFDDVIIETRNRTYVKAMATFRVGDESLTVSGNAREADTKKGMDECQLTGSASSYARKYALNGLFLIDDTKDNDTEEYQQQSKQQASKAGGQQKQAQKPKNKPTAFPAPEGSKITADVVAGIREELEAIAHATGKSLSSVMRWLCEACKVTMLENITTNQLEACRVTLDDMKARVGA